MKVIDSILPKMRGKNLQSTPPEVIIDQMMEPRPLPLGRKEFEEWCDRIIAGAMLPTEHLASEDEKQIFIDSQKCTLAGMILHLAPTESHKPDAFFIHSLRKGVANQVAHEIGTEYRMKAKDRLAKKEAEEKKNEASSPDSPAL